MGAAHDGPLRGRVALVTGAARGIGLATARRLAEEGAGVALLDRDERALAEATAPLSAAGLEVLALAADVADRGRVQAAVTATAARFGGLDVVVNNAAIKDETPLERLDETRWRAVLAVDLDAALWVTQAALPHLQRSAHASVVNVVSTQGLRGQPNALAYATAKGGLVNLTRCLAVDLGPLGIRVNAVAPGFIDTAMAIQADGSHEHEAAYYQDVFVKHGRMPLRRPGRPEDVAGPILFLASDDSGYVTGQVLIVDGGFTCTY